MSRARRSFAARALNGLRVTADALALDYPYKPPEQLLIEGRAWLRRMSEYRGQRITLKQHREVLVQAPWVALLVACVEYDTGNRQGAETNRQGDIEQAVHYGERALTESRRSLPSFAMVSRDLARVLKQRYPTEQATENYLDQLRTSSAT